MNRKTVKKWASTNGHIYNERQKVFDDTKRTETIGQIDKLLDKNKQKTWTDRNIPTRTDRQTKRQTLVNIHKWT